MCELCTFVLFPTNYLTVKLDQGFFGGRIAAEVDGLDGGASPPPNSLHHLKRNLPQNRLNHRSEKQTNILCTCTSIENDVIKCSPIKSVSSLKRMSDCRSH